MPRSTVLRRSCDHAAPKLFLLAHYPTGISFRQKEPSVVLCWVGMDAFSCDQYQLLRGVKENVLVSEAGGVLNG